MQRQGHKLTITTVDKRLVAACECGKWRRTLSVVSGKPLASLVAVVMGKHERHLQRLGSPSAADSSGSMPVLPDDAPEP